ncbi:helix-turn-helix domain-containing protein [Paracoccus yeei]|uniref:helix-turn-helix domain-containing protein n=1 Tax=Paracoccus yeei TaxID=147645 RepID=UPI003BF82164
MTSSTASHTEDQEAALASAVGLRVALRRRELGLSLEALSQRSRVSKGTLVQVEGARANPSISTLCRLAAALDLSVADLVAPPERPERAVSVIGREDAKLLWSGPRGGTATLLAGTAGPDMLEIWHWQLMPGERFEASVHGPATRELIHVTAGSLLLDVEGTQNVVAAGCSAVARTDRPHAYANPGTVPVQFTMVVHEPPASA